MSALRNVAINTGGGDAPGLNAVIRAATLAGVRRNWDMWGIQNGYRSLVDGVPLKKLDWEAVRGITMLGGTILGSANRGNPFEIPVQLADGSWDSEDVSDQLVENFRNNNLDALIAIGGDGSMQICSRLIQKGVPIVGVPKTIDNDLPETDFTLGFSTALKTATEAIDKITTTAESHERIMVVEVMGRYTGWIALHAGISSTADVILLPEIPFSFDSVVEKIREREANGLNFTIVVVAEGAYEKDGEVRSLGKAPGQMERLGGIGKYVADELANRTGRESREVVLGHLQRGGQPTTFDRLLSLRAGAEAVRAVEDHDYDKLIVMKGNQMQRIPISSIAGQTKSVPLDGDIVATARDLGVCLGD